jgi:TfoX/Sxy family transcriptional regulator of competence genes
MAYHTELAARVRAVMVDYPEVTEKSMFGGLVFLLGGQMCCGITKDKFMARVGADAYEDALSKPFTREMDFTGKPLRGFIYVELDGLKAEADLRAWVAQGVAFVQTLPPKKPQKRKRKAPQWGSDGGGTARTPRHLR